MSLDINFKVEEAIRCQHCGEIVEWRTVSCTESGGKLWYAFLEDIGYYTDTDDDEERIKWYGKDMVLTDEQVKNLAIFARKNRPYNYLDVIGMAGTHIAIENSRVVVNANW